MVRSIPLFELAASCSILASRCAVTIAGRGGPLVDGCVLTAAARANNGEQLALADGFGRVRLLRYPAVNDDQVSES